MGAMREAMLREMALRGFAVKTQRAYVGWMARLVSQTRVPADQVLETQVRTYLADLSRTGLSSSTLNQAISAVRFFFNGVLHRDWPLDIHYQRAPQHVPVTLSDSWPSLLRTTTREDHDTRVARAQTHPAPRARLVCLAITPPH